MKNCFLLFFIIFTFSISKAASPYKWKYLGGIFHNNFSNVVLNDNNIIAGSRYGGVIISKDKGKTWQDKNSNLPFMIVNGIAESGSNLLVGIYNELDDWPQGGGTFLSSDFGKTWKNVIKNYYFESKSITVIGSKIFSSSYNQHLLVSSDYGLNWNEFVVDSNNNYDFKSLAQSEDNIYAATDRNIIYFSSDSGLNWKKLTPLPENINIMCIAANGSKLIVGTDYDSVYISGDYGKNWSTAGNLLMDKYIHSFAYCGSNIIAATDSAGLFVSYNDGKSWSQPDPTLSKLIIHDISVDGNNVCLATSNGIYLSEDEGRTWNSCNKGLGFDGPYCFTTYGTIILAGTGNGIFSTADDGNSWLPLNSGMSKKKVNNIAINGANILAAIQNEVFISKNSGLIWQKADSGLNSHNISSLSACGAVVFAGTDSSGVYSTTNNGLNWIEVNNGLSDIHINCLAVNSLFIYAGTPSGVFLSTNFGNSWKQFNNGLTNLEIRNMVVSENNIYTQTGDDILYKYSINESKWIMVNKITWFENLIEINGNKMICGNEMSYGACIISIDTGKTWIADVSYNYYDNITYFNNASGLPNYYCKINCLSLIDNLIFLGTGYGLYIMDISFLDYDFNIQGKDTVCQDEQVVYQVAQEKNAIIAWDVDNGHFVGDSTSSRVEVIWDSPDKGKITLQKSNNELEYHKAVTKNVQINYTPPTPTITMQNNTLFSGYYSYDNQWYLNGTILPGENNPVINPTQNGKYTVELSYKGCKSKMSTPFDFVINTGVDNFKNNETVEIIPNPAYDVLIIRFNQSNAKTISLKIFNYYGVQVYNYDDICQYFENEIKIDLRGFPSGVYYCQIQLNNTFTYKKFLKID